MTEQDQPTSPGAAFWAARGVRIEPEAVDGEEPELEPEAEAVHVPVPVQFPEQAYEPEAAAYPAAAELPGQRVVPPQPQVAVPWPAHAPAPMPA
ncbi:hypothetical protein KDL01_32280, partial [Actinospica durhamensis]|nr:hypothetical protein [Actinospica durhamensis]